MYQSDKMLASERRAALSLALVYVFRMLGLFMVLPVLALYADSLSEATPALLGLAVGAYGLTQAILQIPFGMLSDRIGRKPVIYFGLALFATGSVFAALSDNVYALIAARALQGAGAIAAAVMALASDLSRDSQRTKVMAIIGASIGASFLLSLVLGPLLSAWTGVTGLFWLTAGLAAISAGIILFAVPTPSVRSNDRRVASLALKQVLLDKRLMALNISVLLLHALLTAIFVSVPFVLRDLLGLAVAQHWWVYLPLMTVSLLLAAPLIMRVGKSIPVRMALSLSALLVVLAAALLIVGSVAVPLFLAALTIFFLAFNVLEASLPAQLSKLAMGGQKGAALGVYSSSQFFGAFLGGVAGGVGAELLGATGLAAVVLGLGVLWAVLLHSVALETNLKSMAVNLTADINVLLALPGVKEVSVVEAEGLSYVWFDPEITNEAEISVNAQKL